MKKIFYTLIFGALAFTAYADQYLKVTSGENVRYYPATDEKMPFQNGETITIQGQTYNLSEITSIEVVNEIPTVGPDIDQDLDDNTVLVVYNGYTASVSVAENIAEYIDATIAGSNVTIDQGKDVGDSTGEIIYILKGESDNGSFILNGSYKCQMELQGLTLTNPNGAAIDIENGKRVELSVKKDTQNILADGSNGKQKSTLYCKGHLEFKGKGVLDITGNTGHAISAKEYIEMKNCTVNILGSAKDGINCTQYFLLESGILNIINPGDDGIQVAYKDDSNRESEDTGSITVKDGSLSINAVTAAAAKGLKADNDIIINGGEISIVSNAPGLWDTDKSKVKASSCIAADGNITIGGGTLSLSATGAGGKCMSCDGTFRSTGGNVTGTTTGGALVYRNGTLYQGNYGSSNLDNIDSDYKSSPKAIKADTEVILTGGTFDLSTKGSNGEGIESKGDLTFDGNVVVKVRAYDDATNSSKNTYIKGGTLDLGSTGQGDGVDSNANIYISGGKTTVFSSRVGSEQGLDSGDGNYGTYITGGEILSYGSSGNGKISSTTNSQAFIMSSASLTAGAEVQVKNSTGETIGTFTLPADFSASSSSGGMGGGGGRPGGSSSGNVLISLPGMVSGSSYTVSVNGTDTTSSAQTSGGSSGPGGR